MPRSIRQIAKSDEVRRPLAAALLMLLAYRLIAHPPPSRSISSGSTKCWRTTRNV